MEIKTNSQFKLSKDEIKDILVKHLMKTGHITGDVDMKDVTMEDIVKTEMIPGFDPHDADYVERFDGLKLTVKL